MSDAEATNRFQSILAAMNDPAAELVRPSPEAVATMAAEEFQCFKQDLGCTCSATSKRCARSLGDVMRLITHGTVLCPECRKAADPRYHLEVINFLGALEALFGIWTFQVTRFLPAMGEHKIVTFELAKLPDGEVVYVALSGAANADTAEFDEALIPSLLAPETTNHQRWVRPVRVYVPPGPSRQVSLHVTVKPPDLEFPRDLALRAVEAFHRGELAVSCVLLAASVEAAVRDRLKACYKARGVKFREESGLGTLLPLARLVLDPQPGPKLVEAVQALLQTGRNAGAHGHPVTVTREQVARWMVDVATVYEWTRLAKSRLDGAEPSGA